jgi:NAD(P)H-hydrate epimerase
MPLPHPSPEIVTQLPVLASRPVDGNKGTFGRVLVVAGSRGMSGAAILCALGALRGGAGLVRAAVPQEILPIVASGNPCYLTSPLPEDDRGLIGERAQTVLLDLARSNTAVAWGPGLGQSDSLTRLVTTVITQTATPLVLDADGLNGLGTNTGPLKGRPAPLILTPHPGEFARLLGASAAQVQAHRQEWSVKFAADHGLVLVLKGHATVVTDGRRLYTNTTGNPGMATGGSGDVLSGLIAALLGQGLDAFAAAQLGVYLHGLAGDMARDELGEVAMIASDLLLYLPRAFQSLGRSSK